MAHSPAGKRQIRGALFVIEGIDGSGKTTQAKRLVDCLMAEGYDALSLREPGDSVWGDEIRRRAQGDARHDDPEEEYRLFILDRRQNVERNIRPALDRGRVVVLDRYYFSTMAYQGALGIDPDRIRRENEAFCPAPDLVFYVSIGVSEGLKRIGVDRGSFTSFEKGDYLEKVKAIFDERVAPLPFVVTVNGAADEDEVFTEIRTSALRYLAARTG
jgi:dTMP kinase